MRAKIILAEAFVFTAASFVALGAVPFSDNFNAYTAGNLAGLGQNLVGQGTWAQNNTSTTTPIQVAGGKVLLGTSGQDVYAPLTSILTPTDGTTFYIGATLNLSAAQAAGDYFLHFSPTPGDTSLFFARLFARSSGSGFQLGYMEASGGTNAPGYGTAELSFNTDYRVVIAFNSVAGALNDTAAIYVNPLNLNAEAGNTAYLSDTFWGTASAEPTAVGAINLRQGSAVNAATLSVDDLVVSTTFAPAAVPEPSALGLSLLALGSLCVCLRRKS